MKHEFEKSIKSIEEKVGDFLTRVSLLVIYSRTMVSFDCKQS